VLELLPYLTSPELAELDKLIGPSSPTEAALAGMDAVSWIQAFFRIPETEDKRLQLAPYQEAVLREALSPTADGSFPYNTIVWSDIKKSIKSSIAAAVGLWMAFRKPYSQVTLVANDLKGADSRVMAYMRRAIELNPVLRREVVIRNYQIRTDHKSLIESVPIDPSGEAGGNPDCVIFSELWGAHEKAKERMWTEMTLSPTKRGQSFRWVETYAGFSGEAPLLEGLYENGVKGGERIALISDGFDPALEVFRTVSAGQLTLWNTVPRLPWQTKEFYAEEESHLPPQQFLRVHRNQWVSSESVFVPLEWWDPGCRMAPADVPPYAPGRDPLVVALDAAVSGDTFGMVGLSRHGDRTHVRYVRKWVAPAGGKIDYSGPREEIRRLANEHNVICFTYDPYQLHSLMTDLSQELSVWMRVFGQQAERLIADKELYDAIQGHRVGHNGEPELIEHIQNANVKTEGDNKMRIVKRSETSKVDLAVCLSMANHVAMKLNASAG